MRQLLALIAFGICCSSLQVVNGQDNLQRLDAAFNVQVSPTSHPCVTWGATRLETAIQQAGYRLTADAKTTVTVTVSAGAIRPTDKSHRPEGYQITANNDGIRIVGFDAAGAMYGCLELERRVRDSGRLPVDLEVGDAPALSLRGVCIFLMKSGTYDYPVTPQEFPFFYDKDQWLEHLDFLAMNRFNYIAFWNGHPFDYFVKLDKYPEAQQGMPTGLLERNHDMLLWLAREADSHTADWSLSC